METVTKDKGLTMKRLLLTCGLSGFVAAGFGLPVLSGAAWAATETPRNIMVYDKAAAKKARYDKLRAAAREAKLAKLADLLSSDPSEEAEETAQIDAPEGEEEVSNAEVGKIILRLLTEGLEIFGEAPDLSARFIELAMANWDNLSPAEQQAALEQISQIIAKAQDPSFIEENPAEAAEIIGAATELANKLPPDKAAPILEQLAAGPDDPAEEEMAEAPEESDPLLETSPD